MRTLLGTTILTGLLATGAGVAAPLHAAAPADDARLEAATGWLAWLGCWEPVGEDARAGTIVCVLPTDRASAVRMVTWVDGEQTAETVLHADGVARPVEEGGCVGQETARWSQDGRRVFVRSEFDCGGLGRVSTGVLGMIGEHEWVDAQALTVAGQHAARSVRYRAIDVAEAPVGVAALLPSDRALVQQTARMQLAQPLGIDAVIEASRLVAPPALEALLAAGQHGFDMDAALLQRLAREQVPTSVIDMMVALSYPERFAVRDRRSADEDAAAHALRTGRTSRDVCYDTFFMRPVYGSECMMAGYSRYDRYQRYGYGSRFGYSPWGYDPYGWHHDRGTVVIVRPDRRERGEVVKGRGYTHPGTPTRGSAQPRGRSGEDTSATRPASTRSSGSSSGSSSDDSRGTSTGRTAVPRGGGGGGGGNQ